jgi:hypothetical protein
MAAFSAVLFFIAVTTPVQETKDCNVTVAKETVLVKGSVPLPDGAVLKVTLHRLTERWVAGHLEAVPQEAGGGLARIDGGRFSLESAWDGPGVCSIRATLDENFQEPALRDALKGKTAAAEWKRSGAAWDNTLLPQLTAGLAELDRVAADALAFLRELEQATASEDLWKGEKRALTRKGNVLLAQLDKSATRTPFPAAHGQIRSTIGDLVSNARSFVWKDGKFSGAAAYHNKNEPEMNFRHENFTFANFRRYVDESAWIAGREFALWIVKDLRRAGRREVHREAVRRHADRPGVKEFAPRLEAESEDLATLEEDIRGKEKSR